MPTMRPIIVPELVARASLLKSITRGRGILKRKHRNTIRNNNCGRSNGTIVISPVVSTETIMGSMSPSMEIWMAIQSNLNHTWLNSNSRDNGGRKYRPCTMT